MKRRNWTRIAGLAVLAAMLVAIPASTQVFRQANDAEGADLAMLVLVNRMELTREQMQQIHDLLAGVLAERDAIESLRAGFEQDMIAFSGSAEELDVLLESFRAQIEAQRAALREDAADVIDRMKGILTLKQGEILLRAVPGLLATASASRSSEDVDAAGFRRMGRAALDATAEVRQRLMERIEERLPQFEMSERMRERMIGLGASPGSAGRARAVAPFALERGSREAAAQAPALGAGRAADWIEQLVEVLKLKLEALE